MEQAVGEEMVAVATEGVVMAVAELASAKLVGASVEAAAEVEAVACPLGQREEPLVAVAMVEAVLEAAQMAEEAMGVVARAAEATVAAVLGMVGSVAVHLEDEATAVM